MSDSPAEKANRNLEEAQAVNAAAEDRPFWGPEESYPVAWPSISYPGEASEGFKYEIERMIGWGVKVTAIDGTVVEGVLAGSSTDEDDDWAVVYVWPVAEGDDYMVPAWFREQGIEPTQLVAFNVEVH